MGIRNWLIVLLGGIDSKHHTDKCKKYDILINNSLLHPATTMRAVSESRSRGNRACRISLTKDIGDHEITLRGTLRINEPRKPLKETK